MRIASRNIDGSQLPNPILDVAEQLPVDALQIRKIVGREVEVEIAGSNFREAAFSLMERAIIVKTKAIAQNGGPRVAMRILASTVLVEHQDWRARVALRTASRVGSLRSASA